MQLTKGKGLLGGIFIVLGIVMLNASYSVSTSVFGDSDSMGTMAFPRALIYLWLLASVVYLVKPSEKLDLRPLQQSISGLARVALCVTFYIFLFDFLGVILSTFIFLCIFFWLMEYRNPKQLLCMSAGISLFTWLVFEKLLEITMPSPFWIGLM